jgi:uncharacterized protein HemX
MLILCANPAAAERLPLRSYTTADGLGGANLTRIAILSEVAHFRNGKGEIEGVRYNQLSAIFINAFKEQQSLIEQQKKRIGQQQHEIDSLKKLVCLDHQEIVQLKGQLRRMQANSRRHNRRDRAGMR